VNDGRLLPRVDDGSAVLDSGCLVGSLLAGCAVALVRVRSLVRSNHGTGHGQQEAAGSQPRFALQERKTMKNFDTTNNIKAQAWYTVLYLFFMQIKYSYYLIPVSVEKKLLSNGPVLRKEPKTGKIS
jgi:hypothetical protein